MPPIMLSSPLPMLGRDLADQEYDELDEGEFESDSEDQGFNIRGQLNPAQANIVSTRQLHTMIHEGSIDLNPEYQRDIVWPTSKQIKLIDSIYRNFYIPPVVFAVKKDSDGEDVRICVDGKQRLTSIQKFFDDIYELIPRNIPQIPYRDDRTKKNYWYTVSESAKTSRLEVPQYWKDKFSGKQITCVEYQDLTGQQERDIFQRVQLGMSLTAAEKLQAISSPWSEWMSQLEAQHVTINDGLLNKFEWDTKRGRDFQNIAHFVYCCDCLPEEQIPTTQKLEKWLSRVDPPGDQFKDDIDTVLRQLWLIASDPRYNKGFKAISKRLAPVEFVFIGVLLYMMRGRTLEDRATAIYHLRVAVRDDFKDIRNNSVVGKAMWSYINSLTRNPTSSLIFKDTTSKGRKKRKAQDDGDEYRPEPIKSMSSKSVKTRSRA